MSLISAARSIALTVCRSPMPTCSSARMASIVSEGEMRTPLCEVARSTAEDIEKALDAAHAAKAAWARTSPAERARVLNKIADRMEERLHVLAMVETLDNGKPIRETTAADVPLAADHFRYFAGCIRAQEGSICEIDHTTYAYHFHEPLDVVGQIIPWNFPPLMAAWKVAPGVLNIVNGFGVEAGKPLASNKRIAKVAFTGETTTGRLIMQYAAENIIPVTLDWVASRRTSSSPT